ncbi:MAG: anti-sigma factor family protein [bacterium]|jgi:hypothetical protein
MKCYRDEEIMQYLDGEMTARQALAFEAHTAVCRRCRAGLEEYAALFRSLDSAAAPEPAADFTTAVMAALPAVDFARRRRSRTIFHLVILVLTLSAAALPYLPALRDLGPLYDGLKAYVGLSFNLLGVAGMFLRTVLRLVSIFWDGGVLLVRLLTGNQPAVMGVTGLLLLGEVLLIRHISQAKKGEYANE